VVIKYDIVRWWVTIRFPLATETLGAVGNAAIVVKKLDLISVGNVE
jgi:hypothetical protein